MQQWFNGLERKEQLMLLLAAALVFLYVVFYLILTPMSASVAELNARNQQAQVSLQNVEALAQEYTQLQQSGAGKKSSKTNLTRLIDSTVKSNGLTMNRFQPSSSGDVQVRFENAEFNNILAWLHELENGNAVLIKDLSVSPGSASGFVNVSVRLRQGV